MAALNSAPERRGSLAVQVHEQDPPIAGSERSAKIHGDGRLPHAAFVVDDGNDHWRLGSHSIPKSVSSSAANGTMRASARLQCECP
jgi:hypothetical protein